jgi:alpha-amylase/alpha-mannosidase (GH57 family)
MGLWLWREGSNRRVIPERHRERRGRGSLKNWLIRRRGKNFLKDYYQIREQLNEIGSIAACVEIVPYFRPIRAEL